MNDFSSALRLKIRRICFFFFISFLVRLESVEERKTKKKKITKISIEIVLRRKKKVLEGNFLAISVFVFNFIVVRISVS